MFRVFSKTAGVLVVDEGNIQKVQSAEHRVKAKYKEKVQ
jgi:hypothetical protein